MAEYKCPLCRSACTTTSSGETLVCSACGFRFSISESTVDSEVTMAGISSVDRPTSCGSESPAGDDSAPFEIEGYRIICRIGKGGMGEVFKAEQEGLNRPVAIKVLSRELSKSQQLIQRFDREALALAKLQHPCIVYIINKGKTRDERFFFAMEYFEGDSLRNVVLEGKYTIAQRVQIVLDVAETLAYTHGMNIIHRDIKPENILVRETAPNKPVQVKILDFGLAGLLKEGPDRANLTREGIIIGTPFYMSPEQRANPKAVDSRTDIYSLGVMFYELLTGDIPVGVYKPPSEKNPDVKESYDEIVAKMLEPDPRKRYQLMEQVANDIHAVVEVMSGRAAGAELPEPLITTSPFTTERKRAIVEGRANAGHQVHLLANAQVYQITVSENGLFSTEIPLKDGKNIITAKAVYKGQESKSSPVLEILSLPNAPELTEVPKASKSGWAKIRGRASPGDLIRVKVGDREVQTAADQHGAFDVDCELDEGPNTVCAWAEVEGLRSRDSASAQVLRPVSAPWVKPPPEATRRQTLAIQGTCAPKSEVEIAVDGRPYKTAADTAGQFDYEIPLKLGKNSITVRSVRGGVESEAAGPIVVRRLLPVTPLQTCLIVASMVLVVVYAYTRYQPTIVLAEIPRKRQSNVSGKGPAGATIKVFVNEMERVLEAAVAQDGSFERKNVPLKYGKNTIRVKAFSGQSELVSAGPVPVMVQPPPPSQVSTRDRKGQTITITGRVEEGCQAVAVLAGSETVLPLVPGPAVGTMCAFKGALKLVPGKNQVQLFASAGEFRSEPTAKELYAPPEPPSISEQLASQDGTSVTVRGIEPTVNALVKFRGQKTRQDYQPITPNPDQSFELSLADLDPGENRFKYWAYLLSEKDHVEYRSTEETLVVTGRPPVPEGLGQRRRSNGRHALFGTARYAERVVVALGEKEVADASVPPSGQFEVEIPVALAAGMNLFHVRSKVGNVQGEPASISIPVKPAEPRIVGLPELQSDGTRAKIRGAAEPGAWVVLTQPKGNKELTKRADAKGYFEAEIELDPGENEMTMFSRIDDQPSEPATVVLTAPPPPPEEVVVKVAADLKTATVTTKVTLPGASAWIRRETQVRGAKLVHKGGGSFATVEALPLNPGENRLLLWSFFNGLKSSEVTAVATGEAPKIATPVVTWRTTGPSKGIVSGKVERGSTVEISTGTRVFPVVQPASDGTFQTELDLGYGRHPLRTCALKQGARSAAASIDAVLVPPAVKRVAVEKAGERTVQVSGQSEKGLFVHVREKGKRLRELAANVDGSFRMPVELDFGRHDLEVQAFAAGALSAPEKVQVDVVPPAPDTVAFKAADPSPYLSGRATPGTSLAIEIGPTSFAGKVGTDGQFQVALAELPPGAHSFKATIRAGGVSSPAAEGKFEYVPRQPVLTVWQPAETDVVMEGKVQKGVTVVVKAGDKEERLTPTGDTFTHRVDLPEAGIAIALYAEVQGLKSTLLSKGIVKRTTIALPPPTLTGVPPIVYTRAITLSGQSVPSADVRITVGKEVQTAKVDAKGRFTAVARLQEGANVLDFVTVAPLRKKESEVATVRVTLRLKLDAPALDPRNDKVEEAMQAITGQALPGARVVVQNNDKPLTSVKVEPDGQFALNVTLSPGANKLAFVAELGDAKSPAVVLPLTYIDTIDPPVVQQLPTVVKDSEVKLAVRAPKGSLIIARQVTMGQEVKRSGTGGYATINVQLQLGDNKVELYAERENRKSQVVAFTIRSEPPPPSPPEFEPALPEQTLQTELAVAGSAAKGSTVQVRVNEGSATSMPAPNGTFSGKIRLRSGRNDIVAFAVKGKEQSEQIQVVVNVLETLPKPTFGKGAPERVTGTVLTLTGRAVNAATIQFRVNDGGPITETVKNNAFRVDLTLQLGKNTVEYQSFNGPSKSEADSFEVVAEKAAAQPSPPPGPDAPIGPTPKSQTVSLVVPGGGGKWIKLPGGPVRIQATGDAEFNVFIVPDGGPAAYKAWYDGGKAGMTILQRSANQKSHSVSTNNPGGYYVVIDNANYPDGGLSFGDMNVQVTVSWQ